MIVSQVRYEDGLHDRGCAARAAAQLGQDLPPRSPPRSPGSQPSPPPADPAQPRRNDRKTQETTPTAATDGPPPRPPPQQTAHHHARSHNTSTNNDQACRANGARVTCESSRLGECRCLRPPDSQAPPAAGAESRAEIATRYHRAFAYRIRRARSPAHLNRSANARAFRNILAVPWPTRRGYEHAPRPRDRASQIPNQSAARTRRRICC